MKRHALKAAIAATVVVACSNPPQMMDVVTGDGAQDGMSMPSVPGDRYCANAMNPNPTCNMLMGEVPTCGVCVAPPASAMDRLLRTPCSSLSEYPRGRREYCDNTATMPTPANLSCFLAFDPANPPPLPESRMVTIWGVTDVFGTGGDAHHVRVEVFEMMPDGMPGRSLGFAISDTMSPWSERKREYTTSGDIRTERLLGGYMIPNIPTERPLIIVTRGDPSDRMAAMDFFSHPIYDYTQAIRNASIDQPPPPESLMAQTEAGHAMVTRPPAIMGGAIYLRARVLANADWTIIPSTAALPTGIPPGRGAVAGEVHDCDDVRLSNATVYAAPAPNFTSTVYFSDNDTRPLPDTSRASRGTQLLGLYALLDMAPGAVRVAALGYDAMGRATHTGWYRAQVFADAVTTVTLRGIRPWQVQR